MKQVEANNLFEVLTENKPDEIGFHSLVKKPNTSSANVDEYSVYVSDTKVEPFCASPDKWEQFGHVMRELGYSVDIKDRSITVW